MKSGSYDTSKGSGKPSMPKMPKVDLGKGVAHLRKNLKESDRPLVRDRVKGDVRSS